MLSEILGPILDCCLGEINRLANGGALLAKPPIQTNPYLYLFITFLINVLLLNLYIRLYVLPFSNSHTSHYIFPL
jgi:hypothetical protein